MHRHTWLSVPVLFIYFKDRVSLYSPGWLETCYVEQAGHELMGSACLNLLGTGIKGVKLLGLSCLALNVGAGHQNPGPHSYTAITF